MEAGEGARRVARQGVGVPPADDNLIINLPTQGGKRRELWTASVAATMPDLPSKTPLHRETVVEFHVD